MSDPLLDSLRAAVELSPDDVPLRLHLAAALIAAGYESEAIAHLGRVLQDDPTSSEALDLMARALRGPSESDR